MTELKDLLTDALEFAERHGLDVADFVCDVLTAKADAKPSQAPGRSLAPREDVSYPRHGDGRHDGLPDFERIKAWWYARPVGFRATAKQITEAAGVVWQYRGQGLSRWLRTHSMSGAKLVGEYCGDRSHVFERINFVPGHSPVGQFAASPGRHA